MHHVEFCQGHPPLVLLPGITSPAATWEFVAYRLAAFNDVYVLDHRGRGLSQSGGELGYRLDDYASDVEAFIRTLGLNKATILGHSMGARIAIRHAVRFPEQVGRLILVDPPVSGPGRRPYPVPLDYYLRSLDEVECGTGFEVMQKSLPWTDGQLEMRMEWLPTCDRTAIIESHKSFHDEDIHGDLPHIETNSLLMYAELGDTVRDEEAEEIRAAMPSCTKMRIDGAGHMIPWDKMEIFVNAVRQFLAEASPRTHSQ
ncbi:alpha/beta fold hydrolase [Eoetvoesiella caeni]|uniref:alpha/beta fold hydrolase n=1 Tax=Eoetvoesiella caeni TaxID=645616 RepID=UPI001C5556D8|nr:alpha/beta hydrolase [Eoetvoesiella caeni]MCI2811396.1 alpha/beta hydrolase [Eoetvoesiella caeni]